MRVNHDKPAVYSQIARENPVVVAIGLSYLPRMASFNQPALDKIATVSYCNYSTALLTHKVQSIN